jgi:hypothetical protein
MGQDP